MHTAQAMTYEMPLPRGAKLIGYLDAHPRGRGGACCVIRLASGSEVAWDGAVRALPNNWRELATLHTP